LAVQAANTNAISGATNNDVATLEFFGDQHTRADVLPVDPHQFRFFLVTDNEVAAAHRVQERLHVGGNEVDVGRQPDLERSTVDEVRNDGPRVAAIVDIEVRHGQVWEFVG